MSTMRKRVFSFLLALMMCVSFLPSFAVAQGGHAASATDLDAPEAIEIMEETDPSAEPASTEEGVPAEETAPAEGIELTEEAPSAQAASSVRKSAGRRTATPTDLLRTMPAQELTAKAKNGVTVTVKAEAGILPAGATIAVSSVSEEEAYAIAAQNLPEDRVLTGLAAAAFSLYDAEGAEIEPQGKLSVTLKPGRKLQGEAFTLLRAADEGPADEVGSAKSGSAEAKLDRTGVLALIGYAKERTLTATDGSTYRISVTYGASAGLPIDAELQVEEILPGSEGYAEYLSQSADAIELDPEDLGYAKLFDISIVSPMTGEQHELNSTVEVEMELLDKGDAAARDESLRVIHFDTGDGNGENAKVLDADVDGAAVRFSTNGFSVYAVAEVELSDRTIAATIEAEEKIAGIVDSLADTSDLQSLKGNGKNGNGNGNGKNGNGNGNGNGNQVLFADDVITLTGKMPKNGVVVATPVTVAIDGEEGEELVVAYDIKIYANAGQQKKGKTWQPAGDKITVHFESDAIAAADGKLNVYHMADADSVPEAIRLTQAGGGFVEFEAESFSIYAVTQTVLEKELIASDGSVYRITVTYPTDAGIPADAQLLVDEIAADTEEYGRYFEESVEALETTAERVEFAHAFDISLLDPATGEHIQPSKNVSVSVELLGETLNETSEIGVVHFGPQTETLESTVNEAAIEFATRGFSVYVIMEHEGDAIVTPRVEFHFIAPMAENQQPVIENVGGIDTAFYTCGKYSFLNKATDPNATNVQTTQIVRSGDKLESIEAPLNTQDTYFYGWYTVDFRSVSGDNITYSWPDGTKRVELDRTVTISDVVQDSNGAVTSLKWTVDGVSQTVTENIDADGCAHVYVAPIYNNYYFVNFHLGERGEPTAETIMARKLIVLGNSQQTEIRIGDIKAPSNDPVHVIFIGWEHNTGTAQDPVWTIERTIDTTNNEIVQPGKDGTYLTVGPKTVDLYPHFVQARWINFNYGSSGNGSVYQAPQFMYTSDDAVADEFAIDSVDTTVRSGYTFGGWYVNAHMVDSEILNLNGPESTYSQAIQITDPSGNIVTGTTITGYANALGELVYTPTAGYEKAFEVKGGKLYVYAALNELTVYANWVSIENKTYQVVIWQQKVTDDKDAAAADRNYDYYTHFTRTTTAATASPQASDLAYVTSNPNGDFTGFQLGAYDQNLTVDPQGGTILNVYYDRQRMTMTFYRRTGNGYTLTTNNTGTQYAYLNNEWVELRYEGGVWKAPSVYSDIYDVDDENGTYGLLGVDNYVELTPKYGDPVTTYNLTNTLTAGNDYLIVSGNTAGTRYALGHSGTTIAVDTVTVRAGTPVYIEAADVDATSVWTVSGNYIFQNGGYYLRRSNQNALQISTTNSNNTWGWSGTNNRLSINNRYLRYYNNTFSLNTANNSVYLYQKTVTTPLVGYTYDDNGTPTDYEGAHRYTKSYVPTEYAPYTGPRYTVSNGGTDWRIVAAPNGLYGQTLQQNHYAWPSEYDWYSDYTQSWYGGYSGSGTHTTFIDTFKENATYYGFDVATGAYTYNHYKQNIDGTWPAIDEWANQTSTGNGGTWNFSEKYDGFTVSSYYLGSRENAINNWDGTWTTTSAGGTVTTGNNNLYIRYNRNQYSLTFSANYPDAYKLNEPASTSHSGIPYEQVLSAYSGEAAPAAPSDDYTFAGWYEDASGSVPFNFNAPGGMPAANKIVYAKWNLKRYRIRVNPDGGIIDHIDYATYGAMLAPTGLDGTYFNNDATFFNITATQLITPYENLVRPYIEISDAEAAQLDEGDVYRYVNMQFYPEYGSYSAGARNAVYIKDTDASIDAYYNYYCQVMADETDGTPLARSLWETTYLSDTKYRELHSGENYVQLAWYEVIDGVRQSQPYNFKKPADHDTTLICDWRLDGGYSLRYVTEFYAPNEDYITANLTHWTDPDDGESKYADQATTQAMQEPTAIMVNGVESSDYQFRGWRIVRTETIAGHIRYTPLEPGEPYYTAGQPLIVKGKYADPDMVITMQAFYERRNEAYRRPDVVNLALDASKDASNLGVGYLDPTNGAIPTWDWPGHYYLDTETTKDVDGEQKPYQILFGDTQSNTAVHLYQYATVLTQNEINGAALSPAGVNFFEHTQGYHLVGFDLDAEDDNFVPDYAADAVIAVSPGSSHRLYAVWEPMVYVTFQNDTGFGDVTFRLSSPDGQALYIVNQADGSFSRTPLDPNSDITVPMGETLRLVMPYGANKRLIVSGVNELGTGLILSAASTLGPPATGTSRSLTGELTGLADDYTKVANHSAFGFSDTMVEDPAGVYIRFTAEKADRTLVLDDNHPNGLIRERYFDSTETAVYNASYEIPFPSSRIGYEFQGWADSKAKADAGTVDYPKPTPTIANISTFFGSEIERTLYAVWTLKSDPNTVYVYKTVPTPGDKTKDFTFTVSFTGAFRSGTSNYNTTAGSTGTGTVSGGASISGSKVSKDYTLRDNQYLEIETEKITGSNITAAQVSITVKKFDIVNGEGVQVGSDDVFTWTRKSNGEVTWNSIAFTVTEATDTPDYYDTSVVVDGLYPSGDACSNKLSASGRTISWTDTNSGSHDTISNGHGGTAFYTNERKTADVTIHKTLLPARAEAREFEFTAALENGETYTLNPTSVDLLSGIGEWRIEDVPIGATLTITETVDPLKFNTSAVGETDAGGAAVADLDTTHDNVFRFQLQEDTTITFTNEMISQKLRIVVVDDSLPEELLDSAQFTFPGVFSGTQYAAAGTGIVGGTVYEPFVGDYVLTETSMPNRLYQKLSDTVSVSVTRDGVTAAVNNPSDTIRITGPDAQGVYTITVVNPKHVRVTVKKSIQGFDQTGIFEFTATLIESDSHNPIQAEVINPGTASAQSTDANGRIVFTLANNQTVVLYMPKHTDISVVETTDPAYRTVVQTGDTAGTLGSAAETGTASINSVTTDKYILFTNTHKTINVTLQKTVVGEGGDFDFNALLRYQYMNAGSIAPLTNYTMSNVPNLTTNAEGRVVSFTLSPNNNGTSSVVLTIPYGAELTLTEDGQSQYNTTVSVGSETTDALTTTLTPAQTVQDLTVTFTNSEIYIAPTGVEAETSSYLWMLGAGLALAFSPLLVKRRKRKGGEAV